MQYTVQCIRMFWPSVLMLLCSARPSEQESTDDVVNAIGQLKNLIDSRLKQFDLELNKINTRLDNLDRFDLELNKINTRLDKMDQIELELNKINTRFNSLDQDIALIKDDTQLLFNPQDFITTSWDPVVHLSCGVIGTFVSCNWQHNNQTYQLDDVVRNRYPDLSVESNTATNKQCGITIKKAESVHVGSWTCSVLTSSGKILSGTKTVTVIPTYFEVFGNHVVRAPKKTSDSWSTSKQITYQASLDRCTKMGAVPFIPKTTEDFDFMVHVTKTRLGDSWDSFMWFPATDIETEGHLMWADNTDASDSSFIRWCNNNTLDENRDNRDCTQLNSGRCENTVDMEGCNFDAFPLICEILS